MFAKSLDKKIMAEHIIKTPGAYEEIDIRCPRCNSSQVTVYGNSKGYYEIIECSKCGFKKKPEIMLWF